MRKRIFADDRFVGWNDDPGQLADKIACALNFLQIEARFHLIVVFADVKGDSDFLKRRIAGPLADAVDRALDLRRSMFNGR